MPFYIALPKEDRYIIIPEQFYYLRLTTLWLFVNLNKHKFFNQFL